MKVISCAGFGGQGILTAGILLAHAGIHNKDTVTWYPSYGAEMRGGTANCVVKINDTPIASPYAKTFDILFAMNGPSVDKFKMTVKPGGTILVNTSMVTLDEKTYPDTVDVFGVPADDLAQQTNNPKGANLVMLGSMIKKTGLFEIELFEKTMCQYFEEKGKAKFNQNNKKALMAGYEVFNKLGE